MESSKKVVFFGCCFCVYIGFIGLHNWNKEKKVMELGEPIPVGRFEVKEFNKGRRRAHAEVFYNGKTYRVHMKKSYCSFDSIKSLKLYYDAEHDSMFESHQAVSEYYCTLIFFAMPLVLIFCYIRERKKLKKIESKGQRKHRRKKKR